MLTSGGLQDVDPRLKVILDCHLYRRATILHKIPKRASTARAAGTIILESRADRHAVIMNYLILVGVPQKEKQRTRVAPQSGGRNVAPER